MSGTIIAQVIIILTSPIVTRLYTPTDMGLLASFLAIVSILGIIATGTYDQAIVLPEDEKDSNALVFLSGGIAVLFGIIISVIFIVFYEPLIFVFNLQDIPKIWVYCVGVILTLIGFDTILNRLATRGKQFKVLATTAVAQQIGANGAKVGAGLFDIGVSGLLSATIFGYLIREIRLVLLQKRTIFDKKNFPTFVRIKKVALRYKKFPLISSWSSLLNSTSTQLPVIMFAGFFYASVAGHYALSHRILSLPIGIIGRNVGHVFLESASKVRNDMEKLKELAFPIYKRLLFIGTIIMSFVIFYGDLLFPFVFGKEWFVAGQYAQWISVWLVFVLVTSPLTVIYIVLEKQGELLFINVTMFILRISVILIAFVMGWSDIGTIAGFSIVGAFVYFFWGIRILYLVRISFFNAIKSSFIILFPILIIQFISSFFIRKYLGV